MTRQDWRTPPAIVETLGREFGSFTLDAAADHENAVAEVFFSSDSDGLSAEWRGRVWCNPPYRRIGPWVEKAIEAAGNGAHVVMLLPASVDTSWFRRVAVCSRWWLARGRVRFWHPDEPGKQSPPAGSVIAVFDGAPGGFCGFRCPKTGEEVGA